MKKNIFIFLVLSSYLLSLGNFATAQSPAPTSATEGRVDEIQQIREAIQQKVKEKIDDIIKPTVVRKAIVGTVSNIATNNQITITYQDKNTVANIDPEIVYIDAKKQKSKIANLKVGQEVLVLGNYQTETDLFTAKRIVTIKLTTDIITPPTTTIGQIVDVSQTSNVISLIPIKNKSQQLQIFYDANTKILDTSGNTIKTEAIKSGQKIVAIIIPKANKVNNFTAIRLILTTVPTVLQ